MKALQKNQGRTDQILGAMADMLTSLALPNQQWISETSEERPLVDEEGRGVDLVHWGPMGLQPEQGTQDHPIKIWRVDEVKEELFRYGRRSSLRTPRGLPKCAGRVAELARRFIGVHNRGMRK
ncbi:hypothetical protein SKAU_G00152330 [Synaphobranchus kaupii]|uniref:Uncharacterized protein n=1 Tax=Synaphobranchus kaupii TaxID=118154 RepID=A0A9Q1FH10_SYNKA|nr:hypothetical protein SKAU_G00152330 [Synaphobranchus kaupii]